MRVPIIVRPRALIWSLKDVPWWGHVVALAAAGGTLLLAMYVTAGFYVLAALIVLFVIGVRIANAVYRRRQG